MHHIMNRHEDFPNPLFPQCLHDHLDDRAWLQEGNDLISDIQLCILKKIIQHIYLQLLLLLLF